ncbi:MAG: hypothetical protein U0L05_04840 [Schaedlerella sp.]|nr:hypothetical protein [Schaedlerella sp.]
MKMKRIILITIIILSGLTMTYLIGTGFMKRTDVALGEYSVSEDGKTLTFHAGVISSMGYVRDFKDDGGGVKPHYLTFYSTFGGLNSSFGAKSKFILELEADDTEIYFGRPDGGYELVLCKNAETGEWEKVVSNQKDAYVLKVYEVTDSENAFEKNEPVILVKHYEMSDGTWKTDEYTYQYRLVISGRMNNAAKDSSFVFLSNIEDITFDQAWKASGLSSNMDDYFDVEEAKFVGWE